MRHCEHLLNTYMMDLLSDNEVELLVVRLDAHSYAASKVLHLFKGL